MSDSGQLKELGDMASMAEPAETIEVMENPSSNPQRGPSRFNSQEKLIAPGETDQDGPSSDQDGPSQEQNSGSPEEKGRQNGGSPDQQKEEVVLEKLADDDDGPRDPLWKRGLYFLIPSLKRVEERRILIANDDDFNAQFRYCRNTVTTAKYNIITFLPLNLLEQFLRVANTYFLALVILQVIPTVTSVPFYTTLIPLVGVLSVTAIKDGYDDILRHISDWKVNHRKAHVVCHKTIEIKDYNWKDVAVGDVLRLEKDEFITADILLLSSSEPNSLAFIETAELDGETNLKVRQALPETADMDQDHEKLAGFRGKVECDPPNNRLNKFVGTLQIDDKTLSIDNDSILLRGCRLRNTSWIYGLVIYAGHDTKLVQNSGRTKFKRTRLDLLINRMVIFILCFLGACVFIALIGSAIFESVYGVPFTAYAPYFNGFQDHPAELAFLQVLSNIIVLNTFVPISLYVSVEVIRLGLSLLINWDRKMYYEELDIPATARTTALNEELGQIEYIFSDKTGTLTQNVMTFLKCSIKGVKFGEITEDDMEFEQLVASGTQVPLERSKSSEPVPCDLASWNPYADSKFVFYDQKMVNKCRGRDPDCDEFFKVLALCHTVLPSMESGELKYNAQSPDEAALVSAAKNFGYVFKARSPFTITLQLLNLEEGEQEVEYEMLNILDFNNERKRMSVIVKLEDKITLYCKGADAVVLPRLSDDSRQELEKLTLDQLGDYAREGLRTLVCAKKDLTLTEYAAWAELYQEASTQLENRDQALDLVYEKIEKGMTMIGTTAIEDKLQDGVPDAIANLAKADIKIWVLTGDKQETAINIGYSTKLLTPEMRVFIVDEDSKKGVLKQIREIREQIEITLKERGAESKRENPFQEDEDQEGGDSEEPMDMDDSRLGPPFGIVLNGHSLRYALKDDVKLELLETACCCQAVICCRVTPLQKKKVVDLVKKEKKAVTLAIGDGANDVGMIKAAHIGVGISGREGQQAVLSSDFSFGQFRFLERLLLVHGRWSYHRMTLFLKYFFYKNFAFTFSQFIFAFFCGFTAQTLYDPNYISVYNVIYTSLPVVALAILDQDVNEQNCYRYPKLYIAGQKNKNFNPLIFARSLIKGIYTAFVIFFVLMGLTLFNEFAAGWEWDYQSFGLAASGALTIIVNLQIALDTSHWNPIMHVFVWGSILSWFVIIPFMSAGVVYRGFLAAFDFYVGAAFEVLRSATFWFYWPLAAIIALAPTIITRTLKVDLNPHLVDDVRLLQKKEGFKLFKRVKLRRKSEASIRRGSSVHRSGYAFAQEEGFGRMILNGQVFGLNQQQIRVEQHRRISQMISSNPSTPTREHSPSKGSPRNVTRGISASLGLVASIAIPEAVEVEVHENPITEVKDHESVAVGEVKGHEEVITDEVDENIEEMVKVSVSGQAPLPGSVEEVTQQEEVV